MSQPCIHLRVHILIVHTLVPHAPGPDIDIASAVRTSRLLDELLLEGGDATHPVLCYLPECVPTAVSASPTTAAGAPAAPQDELLHVIAGSSARTGDVAAPSPAPAATPLFHLQVEMQVDVVVVVVVVVSVGGE